MILPTVMRASSDENGSWKIICMFVQIRRISPARTLDRSMGPSSGSLKRISPAVGS